MTRSRPRASGFVHGFTYSHAPVGAAVAREVLRILRDEELVAASAAKGARLQVLLADCSTSIPPSATSAAPGCSSGVELVADRETRRPYPRAARVTEAVVRAARERGVLLYSGTGNADGTDGDTILLGPPFVVTDDELVRIAETLAGAIESATRPCLQPDGAPERGHLPPCSPRESCTRSRGSLTRESCLVLARRSPHG